MPGFQFDNMATFFSMGGHGPFVWAAYGVGLLVMAWLVISPWWQRRQFLGRLEQQRKPNTRHQINADDQRES